MDKRRLVPTCGEFRTTIISLVDTQYQPLSLLSSLSPLLLLEQPMQSCRQLSEVANAKDAYVTSSDLYANVVHLYFTFRDLKHCFAYVPFSTFEIQCLCCNILCILQNPYFSTVLDSVEIISPSTAFPWSTYTLLLCTATSRLSTLTSAFYKSPHVFRSDL